MTNSTHDKPEVGDFIAVPAWKVFGCVMSVAPAHLGSDDAIEVMLQELPDDPARNWRRYRLEPGEYILES